VIGFRIFKATSPSEESDDEEDEDEDSEEATRLFRFLFRLRAATAFEVSALGMTVLL